MALLTKQHILISLTGAAALLSGCVSKTRWDIASTQEKMLQVQLGMSKQEVVSILGTPMSREVLPDKNGVPVEFLQYQTRFAGDAMFTATDAHMTPFAFVNDKLIGWGRNFYDRTARHEISVHENFEDKTARPAVSQGSDKYDDLLKLKKLLDEGVITKEEFERKKAEILQ